MEGLKGISVGVVLVIVSIVLILMSITNGIHIGNNSFEIQDIILKIVAGLSGLGLLSLSIFMEYWGLRFSRNADILNKQTVINDPARADAENFFQTLASKDLPSFDRMVERSIKVRVLARTVVNLVGLYQRNIEELANRGSDIDILVVDPASDSAKYLYGANFQLYAQNANRALTILSSMQKRYPGRIKIKFFHYVPTMSIMIFKNIDDSESLLQIQLYFLHGAIGMDRPIFTIKRKDKWYNIFEEEFSTIWNALPLQTLSQSVLAKFQKALS